jgi:hypothetical protein
MTADDLASADAWVDAALTFWRKGARRMPEALSEKDFARFQRQVLHPELRLVQTIGARMTAEAEALARLTEEQVDVLKGCLDNRRLRVTGAAGTGKTALALEAARQHAAEPGRASLLVCFNKGLAARLAGLVAAAGDGEGTIDVLTFHGLCRRAYAALGRAYNPPSDSDSEAARQFWDVDVPAVLFDAIAAGKAPRYDAIVVDEAQDFHADWSAVLEACLKDEKNGALIVFYDPGQKIFGRKSGLSELPASYSLTVNFRNSQEIASVVRTLGGVQSKPHLRAPIGEAPVVHTLGSAGKTRAHLEISYGASSR